MPRFICWQVGIMVCLLLSTCTGKVAGDATSFNYVYCGAGFDPEILKDGNAPVFSGLGNLNYPVTTKNKEAQKYFNQGLTLAFAFNHGEAARSFRHAARLDSNCAMAWWGYAWVLGPNINSRMDFTLLEEANQAVAKASSLKNAVSNKERLFIEALEKRYPQNAEADQATIEEHNQAFAEGMKKVYQLDKKDAHVITILAESLMDLHPWNFWDKDGEPLPWVKEIQDLLEEAMSLDPNHPGANHYYIHTMEASKTPEKATRSAEVLETLLPAAGHLVHMPSHIYIRTGRYHEGTLVNEMSAKADSNYITQCKAQGAYPLAYFPHNYHFMAATAFLEGNSKKSIEASWLVSKFADKSMMTQPGMGTLQHFMMIPYYTLVHFGKWDEILSLPRPADSLHYPRAVWHYANGMAHAARKNFDSAAWHLSGIKSLVNRDEVKKITIWDLNNANDLVQIASKVLEAEIIYRQAGPDPSDKKLLYQAISLLQEAITIEDKLTYNEPPDWFFSVRLTLGHVLNAAGDHKKAESVYRRELFKFPENGWGLIGLHNSLVGQKREAEAREVKDRFDKAWQWSDVQISTSRIY